MKRPLLRPRARQDRRDEVRHYRAEAGVKIAAKLVDVISKALREIERHPGIGSPTLGHALKLDGMRTWRIAGFPLSIWYFERENEIDVVRLVGNRQDELSIEVGDDEAAGDSPEPPAPKLRPE